MTLETLSYALLAASLAFWGMLSQSDGAKVKMWVLYTLAFVAFVMGAPGYL